MREEYTTLPQPPPARPEMVANTLGRIIQRLGANETFELHCALRTLPDRIDTIEQRLPRKRMALPGREHIAKCTYSLTDVPVRSIALHTFVPELL